MMMPSIEATEARVRATTTTQYLRARKQATPALIHLACSY